MHGWMLHPKVFKNNILYLNSEQSIDFLYFSRFKLAADVGILSAPDILTYITMRLISQRLRHQHWSCCTANFIFVLVLTAPVCHPWCNNHFSSITWKSNSRRLKSDLTFIKNLSRISIFNQSCLHCSSSVLIKAKNSSAASICVLLLIVSNHQSQQDCIINMENINNV